MVHSPRRISKNELRDASWDQHGWLFESVDAGYTIKMVFFRGSLCKSGFDRISLMMHLPKKKIPFADVGAQWSLAVVILVFKRKIIPVWFLLKSRHHRHTTHCIRHFHSFFILMMIRRNTMFFVVFMNRFLLQRTAVSAHTIWVEKWRKSKEKNMYGIRKKSARGILYKQHHSSIQFNPNKYKTYSCAPNNWKCTWWATHQSLSAKEAWHCRYQNQRFLWKRTTKFNGVLDLKKA